MKNNPKWVGDFYVSKKKFARLTKIKSYLFTNCQLIKFKIKLLFKKMLIISPKNEKMHSYINYILK